ncbi:hypothetical protein [Saccharothrix syringae]|uniref:Uncharacterized protein n=1 Tax=Saccharothrix syringae TaxID=103733 RepID=A0A5Q0HB94_SACSY|nr:hypothetical protein [Saccharothrix syringae]QFZ23528.1 hypothetical protein EKG83_44260 [Saccharothrix syringae]
MRVLAVVAAVALGGQVPAGTAAAAERGPGARHCAIGLTAKTPDHVRGASAENEAAPVTCFGTLAESIEFASGGRISRAEVDRAKGPDELDRVIANSAAVSTRARAEANPLLGFHYDYTDFGGDSAVYYGANGTGCYGATYGISNVGDYWNDDFASGKSYSNCDHTVFENANYLGAQSDADSVHSDYGLLAEEVTSIAYTPWP